MRQKEFDRYWHGTRASKLKSILKHGLDPKRMSKDYLAPDEELLPVVFLAHSKWKALEFCPGGGICRVNPKVDAPVLLEVTLPHYEILQILNVGEFVRIPVVIPPSMIKVVNIK